MDIQESKAIQNEGDGIKYLTVSVFLAILIFFIVLSFLSASDTKKSREITEVMKSEFKNQDIGQKLLLFKKRGYEQGVGDYTTSFAEVLTGFVASQKQYTNSELSETPTQYVIKIKTIDFFGFDNNEARPNAVAFLTALNNTLTLNKKTPYITANLILIFNPADSKDKKNINERIKNLYKVFVAQPQKNIKFSIVDGSEELKTKENDYIYIMFSKNEF